jgi:radical SAM protein with 4Fe4S-binding SPASM domain
MHEISESPLWEKLKARRVPLSFDLEVTARCNNDCRHCYINLPAGDRGARAAELTIEEIDRIAGQAVDLGAVWCLLTGGEPMLRPDFADIYRLLKRKGLLVSVFTNATLIDETHIELFRKYPPRDIEVTVYGVTRETYERISRKTGTFDRFVDGLNLLMGNGVRIRLKAMAMQSNLHEQEAIAAFCRARTKDFFRFDPQLHLRFDGDTERNRGIIEERLTPGQIVALESGDDERMGALHKNCSTLINEEFTHFGCNHLFHCGAGKGSFNISYDGKFRLCSSLWAPGTVYDLRRGTLAEAWQEFTPQVQQLRSSRKEFLQSCRVCSMVNLCMWCPAHAHLETGEMDGPTPYFCAVAKARARVLNGG